MLALDASRSLLDALACPAMLAGMRLLLTLAMVSLIGLSAARAADDDDVYKTLTDVVKVESRTINSAGCLVTGSADFEAFQGRLSIFRDAWLNRDYSVDFYRQHQKQVFVYTVLKRAAELFTEGLFSGQDPAPVECSFSLDVRYPDKFGQQRTLNALRWRFTKEQAGKVNWEKFDPRNFHEIALDSKVSPAAVEWMSDEPSMGGATPAKCNPLFFRSNAIFIRATTFCSRNYMDSAAGYKALAGARNCTNLMNKDNVKSAMLELDEMVKQRGRTRACDWVSDLATQVLATTP